MIKKTAKPIMKRPILESMIIAPHTLLLLESIWEPSTLSLKTTERGGHQARLYNDLGMAGHFHALSNKGYAHHGVPYS